jgi:hypothetical protein
MNSRKTAHNLEKNEMKTYASMNQTDSAGDWRECGQCTAIGLAGNYCPNCEDTGMIFSEPVKTGRPMYEDMPRQRWMSRLGQKWRDSFKTKSVETLFEGMEVMILTGKAGKCLQVGLISRVTAKCVYVDFTSRVSNERIRNECICIQSW